MQVEAFIEKIEKSTKCVEIFRKIDEIALFNQKKVLDAFKKNKIAARHFVPTTGYGYDDVGRDTLNQLFADIFGAEAGIASPLIVSGTHALSLTLFSILKGGDKILSLTGRPYDTMETIISGDGIGSLKDFGIEFDCLDFGAELSVIEAKINEFKPTMIYLQRSRGYSWRNPLNNSEIGEICAFIRKKAPNCIIFMDNCYGEFTDVYEPTQLGVDVMAGSLIKNPGGGIAPTGGYVVGKRDLIDKVAYRLTAPSIGLEVGSYAASYQPYYQGLFLAPSVVKNSLKGAVLFSEAFKELGYEALPADSDHLNDIICSIKLNNADALIKFCQTIQSVSPVDSYVTPYPWDMPGYTEQVIMAAGTFVQGASVELSADAPIKEPYTVYVQGGLTYEHVKVALIETLKALNLVV